MEIETNSFLPFLDELVTRLQSGHIGHSVYREPTHTDQYCHVNSHYYPSQKQSVISSLVHRAF